ncbi:hypothetical protein GH714_006110 [Hevea brasiliensis]|uniref:Uncharacterized protein n=1 Tax=Hevea brasiliensis TaxID=3981 RepID=A0A6A6NFU0_HEVBR|nr:hypothetical protein GH714_006110 [Hevea brasiliensis]
MELQPSTPCPIPDLQNPNNGVPTSAQHTHLFSEDVDSTCSTPYVSAPSSPGRGPGPGPINGGFFYSCPASPMHFATTTTASSYSASAVSSPDNGNGSVPIGYEFEFSARLGSSGSGQTGSMSSADELFFNGQIRPMKLSTHLERPQVLAPLLDLENEDEEEDDMDIKNDGRIVSDESTRGRDLRLRDKSLRRRTRSMSPLRSTSFEFANDDEDSKKNQIDGSTGESCESSCLEADGNIKTEEAATPSVSASSSSKGKEVHEHSRCASSCHNKREGWHCPAVSMENQKVKGSGVASGKKPVNGVGKRRVPTSPHELHYKASKAQAEEMKKKTFLPYRQGLLGCLGFSSKGYGAMNGFARALNPVSSR